eukprot:GHVO01069439.1.p1 GENE.GHVO01069439.1~~GHVO01069439.1.p1  ORF type:complete len:185 (-),score=10.16 GHVO01069439.1:144-674(-)
MLKPFFELFQPTPLINQNVLCRSCGEHSRDAPVWCHCSDPHSFIDAINARRLLKTSCLLLFPIAVAIKFGLWDCACINAFVLSSSINHWRRPRLGLRRSVDQAAVFGALIAHTVYAMFRAYGPYGKAWLGMAVVGCSLYLIGRYHGNRGDHDTGTTFHQGLHFFGCVANVVLYIGL